MKKLLLSLLLLGMGLAVSAQKSYVTAVFYTSSNQGYLSGDVPEGVSSAHHMEGTVDTWMGKVLNLLAEKGFVVEQMNTVAYSSGSTTQPKQFVFLLSKAASTPTAGARIIADNCEEVTEVARYNLQGMSVSEGEKGIQIIVYSNYTTKTVIVE